MSKFIYGQRVWSILKEYGFNHNKDFEKKYDIFYRSTKFTPEKEWLPAILSWTIVRDYGPPNTTKPTKGTHIECCVLVNPNDSDPYKRNYPWFIWDDKFGFYSLVLKEK